MKDGASIICSFGDKFVCLQSDSNAETLNQNANAQQITEK
jgi:hypothetical protein